MEAATLSATGLDLELVSAGAAVRRLIVNDGRGPIDVVLGHADARRYATGGE
jgi:aldose 1-epimerase